MFHFITCTAYTIAEVTYCTDDTYLGYATLCYELEFLDNDTSLHGVLSSKELFELAKTNDVQLFKNTRAVFSVAADIELNNGNVSEYLGSL